MDFSVLPVEFHAILDEIKQQGNLQINETAEGCLFLVNNACTIYEFRPSICRSHGLPVLNMDDEGENWELSYCPLNFEEADEEYFTLENGFQQDLYNSKLYLANQAFIASFKEITYREDELVDMSNLKRYL
jgi:Fe-S-cluster containining protein